MSNAKEQVCRRHVRIRSAKWSKRRYAKWRRRVEKRDPEDAPKRPQYEGWTD